ncbi:IS3 family transposase [Chloroflexota bacterium]
MQTLSVSQRRACQALGQYRTTQIYPPHIGTEEEELTSRITELASQYGRYGYRRITTMLNREGWQVNHKKVERIWRKEGLRCRSRRSLHLPEI